MGSTPAMFDLTLLDTARTQAQACNDQVNADQAIIHTLTQQLTDAQNAKPKLAPLSQLVIGSAMHARPGWVEMTDSPDKPHGTSTLISGPGQLGVTVKPARLWDNFYILNRTGPLPKPFSRLIYRVMFGFATPADFAACNAFEFECQARVNGFIFNFAWQAQFSTGRWRPFHYVGQGSGGVGGAGWVDIPNAPMVDMGTLKAGKPLVVQTEFSCDVNTGAKQHEAIMVNGSALTFAPWSDPAVKGDGNSFNCAIQFDTKNMLPVAGFAAIDYLLW